MQSAWAEAGGAPDSRRQGRQAQNCGKCNRRCECPGAEFFARDGDENRGSSVRIARGGGGARFVNEMAHAPEERWQALEHFGDSETETSE